MKRLLIIFLFSCSTNIFAQHSISSRSVQGAISAPSMMSMDVNSRNVHLGFNDFEEFAHGKVYPSCMNIIVKSNVPWTIKVRSDRSFLAGANGATSNVPCGLIRLKPTTSQLFTPLSANPQTLLVSSNNNILNNYGIDIKIDAPWNAVGGDYTVNMVFSISAQ